jgi:hypothetical protein
MYLSIALFLYLSDYIHIYISVSLLSVCHSISLSKGLCLCPSGHIFQTKMTRSIVADVGAPLSNLMCCSELRVV